MNGRCLPGIARTASLVAALLLAGQAAAAPTLTPHSAEYRIRISVLGGTLTTQLDSLETGWRAESSIEATGMSRIVARGSIRESSVFEESEAGLRPSHFLSTDTLSKGGQAVDLAFDWRKGEVSGQIDGEHFEASLDGLVHDRVSLQYGLMHDLLNGVDRQEYALQDAERLKPLQIKRIGSKRIEVPFGTFEAIGIQHQAENSSRVTTLWCVEELGYLPAIIEQHRQGKLRVRAVLTDYQPGAVGVAAVQ